MNQRFVTRFLTPVFLMLAMFATACGSSGSDSAADTGSAEESSAESAESAESSESATESTEPAGDGRFVYAAPSPIFDIDPNSSFSTEGIALHNVYDTLTRFNPPGSADLVSPNLATDWTSNDDLSEWTFTLRDDVTFHDGTKMTAESVRGSLQRTIDLGLGAAFIFGSIESMDVVDDTTITFNLGFPAPLDLVMSSAFGAYIMSADATTQETDWFNAGNDGGTGPYMITSHLPNESTTLARYDDYWGGWSDKSIDEVEIQIVEDSVLAEQLLRSGDADFSYNLSSDSIPSLEGEDGLAVVRGTSMTNLTGLLNHVTLSPEAREALILSFPYDDITAGLYGGEANRAQGVIPQAVWGSSTLDLPDTDLDAAAKILADAGETGLTVTYSFDAGDTQQQQIGEVWKASLATIDVDLQLEPLTFDARWEIQQGDPAEAFDVFALFWFPTYVTPYDYMFSMFRSEEFPFFNLGYHANADFDALIDEGDFLTATDRAAAEANFAAANQMLIDTNAAVFMLDVPDVNVINSAIDGYVSNPGYSNVVRFNELTENG